MGVRFLLWHMAFAWESAAPTRSGSIEEIQPDHQTVREFRSNQRRL